MLLHPLDSTLRLFTLVCGDIERQGKNYYLDRHYLSSSCGGLKLEGNGPVYALKSELAAKKGIHEAGVEKAVDWPENVGFMTVWYNKTMVKRIERDIKENGAVPQN